MDPTPKGVPPNKHFGVNIMAMVAAMHVMGISFGKIGDLVEMFYGRRTDKATLMDMCNTASDMCRPAYRDLLERLKHAAGVAGDETGRFLGKLRRRVWVFVTGDSIVYVAADTRGRAVPARVPGGMLGVVLSDSFAAWNGFGSVQQKCLVHCFRNISPSLDGNDGAEFAAFAESLKSTLKRSPELHGEFGCVTPGRYVQDLLESIDRLARGEYADGDCIRFAKRLRRERDSPFTFLQFPVDFHNNASERALRMIAIMRKTLYGNRSERGERTTETPATIYAACRLRGTNPYEFILAVLNGEAATVPPPETPEKPAAKTAAS